MGEMKEALGYFWRECRRSVAAALFMCMWAWTPKQDKDSIRLMYILGDQIGKYQEPTWRERLPTPR